MIVSHVLRASAVHAINSHTVLRRGEAVHGLFDAVVGMS
jgi:hypothetical protein